MRTALSTSETIAPISATRSWLLRDCLRKRRPNQMIGTTTIGTAISRPAVSLGASQNRMATPTIVVITLRSATETVVPTTISMSAVSAVIREEISLGLLASKKEGGRRSRFFCTERRISATTRSPSHETL